MTWRIHRDERNLTKAEKIAWDFVLPQMYIPIIDTDVREVKKIIPLIEELLKTGDYKRKNTIEGANIDAAPDILTALRRLTYHSESAIHYLETVDDEDDQAAINKFIASVGIAKEAIAKAEGK